MLTRSIEHQKDSMRGKWESAWSTEHSKDTSRDTAPKTLAKLSNIHERKIRKSLQINNLETKAEYDKSITVKWRPR